jgi:WG containing repeat
LSNSSDTGQQNKYGNKCYAGHDLKVKFLLISPIAISIAIIEVNRLPLVFLLFLITAPVVYGQLLIPIQKKDSAWSYYSTAQRKTLDLSYGLTTLFRGKLGLVQHAKKWGAVDATANLVIPVLYSKIEFLDNETLIVSKGNILELLDNSGRKLSPNVFREITPMMGNPNHLVVQTDDRKFGIIDRHGKVVLPIRYATPPEHITDDHLLLAEDSPSGPLFGIVKKDGSNLIPFGY